MKNINKSFLMLSLFISSISFSDEIKFLSPMRGGFSIKGKTKIQIEAPAHKGDVKVCLKSTGRSNMVVWRGVLTSSNNYTMTVNADRLPAVSYNLLAEYQLNGRTYKGKLYLSVSESRGFDEGEYFPEF